MKYNTLIVYMKHIEQQQTTCGIIHPQLQHDILLICIQIIDDSRTIK